MSNDIGAHITEKLKDCEFSLQADESTDISGKAPFLTFIRFIYDGQITEQFFCCKELPETTKEQYVFETLTSYLGSRNLSWEFKSMESAHISLILHTEVRCDGSQEETYCRVIMA